MAPTLHSFGLYSRSLWGDTQEGERKICVFYFKKEVLENRGAPAARWLLALALAGMLCGAPSQKVYGETTVLYPTTHSPEKSNPKPPAPATPSASQTPPAVPIPSPTPSVTNDTAIYQGLGPILGRRRSGIELLFKPLLDWAKKSAEAEAEAKDATTTKAEMDKKAGGYLAKLLTAGLTQKQKNELKTFVEAELKKTGLLDPWKRVITWIKWGLADSKDTWKAFKEGWNAALPLIKKEREEFYKLVQAASAGEQKALTAIQELPTARREQMLDMATYLMQNGTAIEKQWAASLVQALAVNIGGKKYLPVAKPVTKDDKSATNKATNYIYVGTSPAETLGALIALKADHSNALQLSQVDPNQSYLGHIGQIAPHHASTVPQAPDTTFYFAQADIDSSQIILKKVKDSGNDWAANGVFIAPGVPKESLGSVGPKAQATTASSATPPPATARAAVIAAEDLKRMQTFGEQELAKCLKCHTSKAMGPQTKQALVNNSETIADIESGSMPRGAKLSDENKNTLIAYIKALKAQTTK